ncbi:MAG: AI-2E family transporter [Planctomycetes bacterium]|nr:AI-2E family transporter [Planctomycetota bacterium]
MFPLSAAGRIGLTVLLLLAGVVALRLGELVFVPVLIALLLATVLGPAAWWLHTTLKVRWGLACITVVLGLILANVVIVTVFSASVLRLVNEFSEEKNVIKNYNAFRGKLEKMAPFDLDAGLFPKNPETLSDIGVFRFVVNAAPDILKQGAKLASDWTWQLVVILFITFFVLLEGRVLARRAVAIVGPTEEVQAKATEVLFEMAKQVRTYLVWRTLINVGLAIVMGLVYHFAGLTQAWTWAILLAILNYVPYLGPVLASVPPFLDAFIFSEHPGVAIVVTIIFWVVIVLEGYLVVPLLMGRNMDLNATTVMVACLFWELVWPGMTGLFLAMPIMAGVKAILYNVPEWRVWATLMSAEEGEDELLEAPAVAPASSQPPSDSANGTPSDASQPVSHADVAGPS